MRLVLCTLSTLTSANNPLHNTIIIPLENQASFANVLPKKSVLKIAYMPPATEFNFYLDLWKGISAAASESGVDIFMLAPQKDNPAEQMKMLSGVLHTDVSTIILATHDKNAAAPLIKTAVEKGIVVIIVNSDALSFPTPVHAIIGYKQQKSTYQLGQYALSLSKGKTMKVGIIEGESGYHSDERVKGFEKAIQNSPLQIVTRKNGHWNTEGGYAATLDMFSVHPDIKMVFAANDFEIIGAEAALKTLGIDDVLLFGNDGAPATLASIVNGKIAATVYANPILMGRVALKLAMDSIAGQFHGGGVEIPSKLITQSNVTEYLPSAGAAILTSELKEVSIISEPIQGLTGRDGTGLYWDMLRAIYEPQGVTVNIISVPLRRAQRMIEHKKADVMLGHYRGDSSELIFPQWHYSSQNISAIFKKTTLSWKGQKSLAGKRVAWIRGADYDKYLAIAVLAQEHNDHISPLIMLKRGRIDFFLDDQVKILDSFQSSAARLEMAGFDRNNYQIEPVLELKLYPAFADTARGQKLAEIFDTQLPQLLSSGKLKTLFERWKVKNFPFD